MKKALCLVLAALFAAASMAGCGKSANSSSQAATDSSKAKEEEKVTLTLWETTDNIDDFYKKTMDDFMQKNPNIILDTVVKQSSDGSDLMAAIASGTAPDISWVSYPMMHKYIYANALTDLTDRLESWDQYDQLNESMLDMFKVNDKYYGVPRSQYTMVLYYNKQLFKDAGVNPPTTWDEWLTSAEAMTDPSKQQYGFALNYAQWAEWWFEMFAWGAGGDLTTKGDDGSLSLTFTDPAVIKAAEFYRELKAKNVIQSDTSLQLDDLKKEFALGRASMIIDASDSAAIQGYITNGMDPNNIGTVPIPTGPSGKGPAQVGGALLAIPMNKDEAKVDAAFELIKYYMSKEYIESELLNDANNGIKSYVVSGRKDVDITTLFDVPEDVKSTLDYAVKDGNSQLEFYGKAVVGTFVDQAVQEIMLNDSKDIESVFKKYQDEAMKKEVPDYNEAIKSGSIK